MIVTVKYFYGNTDADIEEYDSLWIENVERIVYLHPRLSIQQQISSMERNITDSKDIVAICSPTDTFMTRNAVIDSILRGRGFIYDNSNKIWYPKEVWIYNPVKETSIFL